MGRLAQVRLQFSLSMAPECVFTWPDLKIDTCVFTQTCFAFTLILPISYLHFNSASLTQLSFPKFHIRFHSAFIKHICHFHPVFQCTSCLHFHSLNFTLLNFLSIYCFFALLSLFKYLLRFMDGESFAAVMKKTMMWAVHPEEDRWAW